VTCRGVKEKLSLVLRTSELLFGIAQKVTKKARHRPRCSDSRQRIGMPCASRLFGVAQTVRPCTASRSRRSVAAPLRAISLSACDARHRERRRRTLLIRPSMDCAVLASARRSALLLGPLCIATAAAVMREAAARWIAPIPLSAHGCAVSGTQASCRALFGQEPEKRNAKGVVSLGYLSLHEQRKVTRSPQASESCAFRQAS